MRRYFSHVQVRVYNTVAGEGSKQGCRLDPRDVPSGVCMFSLARLHGFSAVVPASSGQYQKTHVRICLNLNLSLSLNLPG